MKRLRQITLEGLRGGCGTTSVAAMLADTLRQFDQKVLVIDLDEQDLLRLHFNIPYADDHGWAACEIQRLDWLEQTYEVTPKLWVLPYGRHAVQENDQVHDVAHLTKTLWTADFKSKLARNNPTEIEWILFDLPYGTRQFKGLKTTSDLNLLVSQPDMAAHIRLGQRKWDAHTRILVNGINPSAAMNEAIVLDWSIRYAERIVPVRIHEDRHVQEALAHKMPATTYFAHSAAARNVQSLALWCLAQKTG